MSDASDSGSTAKTAIVADVADPPSSAVEAAMVAVSVDMRFVGVAEDTDEDAQRSPFETSPLERALHTHLKRQEAAIAQAAIESMTDIPGATAEARVMQGSIEVLVVISVVLGLLRSYNEFYATVETATANTRRIVERLADAYLAQPASPTVPVQPGWHAATTAHWWLAPAALAAAREPTAAAAGPISRVPRLPAIDARAVVLWALGVVTFLTALYVAASILLEVFAD